MSLAAKRDAAESVAYDTPMALDHSRQPAAGQRFILGTFALGHLSNDWAAGAIWMVAPAAAAAMGLGATEVGLLLAIHGLGAALAYIPAGMLADRVSRRGPLLVLTFAWVVAGYAAASLAPDFWSLAVLLAVAVMGDAAWHPIATGLLVQRYPKRRAHVLGIHAMGGTIGAEVLAPVGVGLALTLVEWRVALQVSVVPAALMGVAFIFVSRRLGACAPRPGGSAGLTSVLRAWTTRQGRLFVVAIVLYNMAYMAVLGMVPLFLQQDLSFTPLAAGAAFAVMLTLGSLLQPLAGQLSDRIGRRPLLIAGTAAGALCAGVAGLVNPGWMTVAALLGTAAFLTAIRSVVLAAAVEIASQREATNLGMAFTLMDGVGAIGAALGGFAGRNDLTAAFLLGSLLAWAALLSCCWLRIDGRRPAVVAAA